MFVCPKCKKPLEVKGRSYYCENGHCFDVAKEGYVNLLTVDKKHSIEPGDDKNMVRARYDFLERGYYKFLAEKLAELTKGSDVLDAGCGSGYYTRELAKNGNLNVYSVDIAKEAVRLGAKRGGAKYAVAGVYDLPFADGSFDTVLNVFSPFAFDEYARVLKDDGVLLSVYPAPKHLVELKQELYGDKTFDNEKSVSSPLFDKVDTVRISKTATLSNEDVFNLYMMTPYYFTTAKEKTEHIKSLEKLELTLDFEIAVFAKKR